MIKERDSSRFDNALEEVTEFGGGVQLLSWAGKNPTRIPETSSNWGDISTTIRHFLKESVNKSLTIRIGPNGRGAEVFYAKWQKAEREAEVGEVGLGEDAMDTLIFQDNSKFHFDIWSEGEPFELVKREQFIESNRLERIGRLIFGNPETRLPKAIVFSGLAIISAPWWEPFAQQLLVKYFDLEDDSIFGNLDLYVRISGWILFVIGIWLYIKKSKSS